MDLVVATIAGLALLGTTYALPIGSGIGGIALAPGALGSFYNQEVVIGDYPVNIGFGIEKDGTVSAGIRYVGQLQGKDLPLSAAVSGNFIDLKNTFKFEVGTRVLDSLSGLIYGNREGLKWMSNLWIPVIGRGINAIGVALEGDKLKPVAISGGFGLRDKVYQARVALDRNLKPNGANFFIGTGAQVPLNRY